MSKQLQIINCQPQDPNFWWQVAVQAYNLRKFGLSDKLRVLLFLSSEELDEGFNPAWKLLEEKFPEVRFFYYADYNNLLRTIRLVNYPSLIRPYCLEKHFKEYPELKDDAIFYLDADVILTKPLKIEQYLDDDVNYLSYTGNWRENYNYICYDHFKDKEENIRPERREYYNMIKPVEKLLGSFYLSKQDFIDRKDDIGGAQYLLKNVDYHFWQKVFDECVNIRTYLQKVNQSVMKGETVREREDNGFQSWCADMWAMLWTLWKHKKEVKCPREMDFAWATDKIKKWDEFSIYHDAGTVDDKPNSDGDRLFYKRGTQVEDEGQKVWNYNLRWSSPLLKTPFQDDLSYVSNKYCSFNYVKELKEAQKYLNL